MTEHHKGRRLFALEVHGPAAIGMGWFVRDVEMLALIAVWFISLRLRHLISQPFSS